MKTSYFKPTLLFVLLTISSICISQKKKRGLVYDTSNTAIIPFDKFEHSIIFDTTNKPATLALTDFELIDSITKEAIKNNYSTGIADDSLMTSKLTNRYKKQIIATIDINEEKIVWIGFFCNVNSLFSNWKKELIRVYDGGNCFFNFKINLAKKTVFKFFVNEEG